METPVKSPGSSMPLIRSASPVDLGKLAVKLTVASPSLVEQEHGGALLNRGVKGHTGAGGRPPAAIREAARLAFSERLYVLTGIADDENSRASDRIRAIALLGKYGGVDKLALIVEEQPEQEMTPERIADLFEKIERIKTIRQLEKMLAAPAEEQAAARGE